MNAHRLFRFGVVVAQARSAEDLVTKARRIEALGFATLLLPDTLGPTLAPLPALAMAAAATATLRVGSYVLANDFRNPALVAREAATIDLLSGGRFELGLGVGRPNAEEDYRKLGLPFEAGGVRVARLAEALSIIKPMLAGESVTSGGAHYDLTNADGFPPPTQQPRLPILIAAGGKRLLALAAREADILALAVRPDTSGDEVQALIDGLREAAGARFEQLELNVNLLAVGDQVPSWISARFKLDPAQMEQAGSPIVLTGSVDQMCEQLLARRERFGISYIAVGEEMMDALAPAVARLAGR
jgi:probable F420-dependent oxidoreductase